MKSSCVTIQMEATLKALDVYTYVHITRSELPMVLFITQYSPMILFVLLHKMVRSFESGMDEILKCDLSNGNYRAILSVVLFIVQDSSKSGRNSCF